MDGLLKQIYELYTDYVLKNPFYEMEMPIRCELFDINLAQAVLKDRVALLGRWSFPWNRYSGIDWSFAWSIFLQHILEGRSYSSLFYWAQVDRCDFIGIEFMCFIYSWSMLTDFVKFGVEVENFGYFYWLLSL